MSVTYEQWHQRIDATLKWREQYWNGTGAWKRYFALYRGDHWRSSLFRQLENNEVDSENPRDRITVMDTLSTILTIKPFLIKRRPKFILRARRQDVPEDVVSAFLQQETLNYAWRELKMQKQARNAVLDALIIGHGILKTGFTFNEPEADKPVKEGEIEYREYIRKDSPYLERINPLYFIFDIEGCNNGDLESSRWCAQIFFRSREDVIADSTYNKAVRSSIKSGFDQPEVISPIIYKEQNEEEVSKRCILYEVWDKKYRKYYVLCKGINKPLIEEDWPYDYLEGYPFVKLDYIPIPNEPFGVGIPYKIEDQQLEKNRVRTTMFEHRRRFNRKYIAIEGEIQEIEKDKFTTGSDGTVVWAKSPSAIVPIQDANLTSDNYRLEEIINRDYNSVTGIDALVRNAPLPGRTSAAEISARQGYTNLKLDDRVEDVDEFIMEAGRKVLQHIKANFNSDQIVEIVGPLGRFWVQYSPEDIQAETEFDMDTVSAPRIDPAVEKQQAIELLQVLSSNLQVLTQMQVLQPQEIQQIYRNSIAKIIGENKELSGNLRGIGANVQPGTIANPQQLAAGLNGGLSTGNGGGIPTAGGIQ